MQSNNYMKLIRKLVDMEKGHIFRPHFALLAVAALCLVSCSKMDSTYDEFLAGGEYRYSKKPDSVSIHPGRNRAEVWMLISSPTTTTCKVFWNDRLDSIEIPVEKKFKVDTVTAIIEDMDEGSYTFEFITIDNEGNASLAIDTTGEVYGNLYLSSLHSRIVEKASMMNNEVTISWLNQGNDDALVAEVEYKDAGGTIHVVHVDKGDSETKISPRPQRGSIQYRSLFLPHPDAIDTFYTAFQTIVPEAIYAGFPENFEDTQHTKFKYAADDIEIGSGLWRFDNFLIGDAAGDNKNGSRSLRSQRGQTGSGPKNSVAEMLYDLPDGASKISFYHGICASDDPSSFKVQMSRNGGADWEDISEVIENASLLAYREILLDVEGPVRFRFYKLSNVEAGRDEGRMNLDDIDIYPN